MKWYNSRTLFLQKEWCLAAHNTDYPDEIDKSMEQIKQGKVILKTIGELKEMADDSYLECGLPAFLQESVLTMTETWRKLDDGQEYLRWDCDYCNLQSDINSAEVNRLISNEQAWYLREKYLRMERA